MMIESNNIPLICPVIELFHSIQGEGKYAGQPSFFIRTTGCNLRCVFGSTICDTAYSSFHPESPNWSSIEDFIRSFDDLRKQHPHTSHIVITGGEPMLNKKSLEQILSQLFMLNRDWIVTIETNGTLPIFNPLDKRFRISLYSISPKLKTSVARDNTILADDEIRRHDKLRINIKNLFNIISSGVDYQMKFVYTDVTCVEEIKDIYSRLSKFIDTGDVAQLNWWMRNHPNKHTMLMPEGIQKSHIESKCEETAEVALRNGWGYSDRLHIRLWGNKRGV